MAAVKKINKHLVILGILLVVGLFLRVVDIDNIPKAIYGDGLTGVYDSYSLLKTGHDQKGNFLPFVFQLGDHRPPGYIYASIPFTALFGPTALAANSASILSGLGIIILLFLLGKILYSERVGLLAATFATFSPWELSLSRGPFETHLALFLALLGVYIFFKSKQNPVWLILSIASFGASSLTYPTYGLTAPLLLILLLILERRGWSFLNKNLLVGLISAFIFLSAVVLSFSIVHGGNGPSRAESLSIFTNQDLKAKITQQINSDRQLEKMPLPLISILHNHFLAYGGLIFDNYFENFRPSFLLISGDREPRHNPAEMGELFWATGILAILGIIFLHQKKILVILLGWLFIAPLATAVIGPPHALRDSLMLPPLLLLAAFGGEKILESKNSPKKIKIVFLIGLFLIETVFFIDKFYFIAPNKFARFWSYPAKQATQMALKEKSNFNFVILSTKVDNMEYAYPVYAKLDPNLVIAQNQQPTILNGSKFLNYDNVYVGSVSTSEVKKFINSLPGLVLFIGSPEEAEAINSNHFVQGPDFQPALVILEKK